MKSKFIRIIKTLFLLIGIQLLVFVVMIVFVMSDEPANPIGSSLHYILKYILGFPLVIINDSYPFFLNSQEMPKMMIPLILINDLIQVGIILGIINLFRKKNKPTV